MLYFYSTNFTAHILQFYNTHFTILKTNFTILKQILQLDNTSFTILQHKFYNFTTQIHCWIEKFLKIFGQCVFFFLLLQNS